MSEDEIYLEIKKYKNWINSLNLKKEFPPKYDLINECRRYLLFYIFDKIRPNKIIWSKVNMNTLNNFYQISNLSILLELIGVSNMNICNIDAIDLIEGHPNKIFAILWNFMRIYYIENINIKKTVNDEDIIKWAEIFKSDYINIKNSSLDELLNAEDRIFFFNEQLRNLQKFKSIQEIKINNKNSLENICNEFITSITKRTRPLNSNYFEFLNDSKLNSSKLKPVETNSNCITIKINSDNLGLKETPFVLKYNIALSNESNKKLITLLNNEDKKFNSLQINNDGIKEFLSNYFKNNININQ